MFISQSDAETMTAGSAVGRGAKKGDIFALTGDLGAGKTQFVKGIVAGVECSAEVTSPTFTLIHEYSGGRLPVYHFDWYRLGLPQSVLRLGLDEYLFGDGLCVVEWADRFPALLPEQTRWISISINGESERAIEGLPIT